MMNNNMMELNLDEMAMVTGGSDAVDHAQGAFIGGMVCGVGGLIVGGLIAGGPGAAIGFFGGAIGGGVAGGILGASGIASWFN